MNFETAQNALKAWWATQTGLQHVVWEDEPRPFSPPSSGALGILNMPTIAPVGVDETRWAHDSGAPAGADMIPTQVGNRRVTLVCKVESISQKPADLARAIVERARTRARRPSSIAALVAAGFAVIRAEATRSLSFPLDDRMRPRASFDLLLGLLDSEATGDTDTAASYIAKVRATTSWRDPAGVALGPALQLVNKEIP